MCVCVCVCVCVSEHVCMCVCVWLWLSLIDYIELASVPGLPRLRVRLNNCTHLYTVKEALPVLNMYVNTQKAYNWGYIHSV